MFHTFTDSNNISRMLVRRKNPNTISIRLYQLELDEKTKKYSQKFICFTQDIYNIEFFDFQMTSLTKAISIYYERISYWQNLNEVIDYSRDPKYGLIDRQKVAISYNEYYFVMKQYTGYRYEFYHLDEQYEFSLQKSIFIDYNQHVKG